MLQFPSYKVMKNVKSITDLVASAIRADDDYNAAIVRLQQEFANKTDVFVRATLLPIVGAHYGLTVGKTKAGPTAGQLGFILGDNPSDDLKTKRALAQQKLGRLVNSICNVSPERTPAQIKAANLANAMKAIGKLTDAQKKNLVSLVASELGLTVK